ncbi:hypothetical protein [uncultured Treponema sp.]|uniref:hypothetical protein n=1 Tax=uncultured Treponema sp. TaxID=162155 RepID=UPI002624A8DF|nr:hypothetical protein [uncultured Treponema sp.]
MKNKNHKNIYKKELPAQCAVGLSMATAYASDQTQAFVFARFFQNGLTIPIPKPQIDL